MAGPVTIDPERHQRKADFGFATERDLPAYLGIMGVLHREPINSSFARLLAGQLKGEDGVALAHVLEEIAVLARHHLIAQDLLFDAFAIDRYWDQLAGVVGEIRSRTENPKFCENFELCGDAARLYRLDRPALGESEGL